MNEGLQVDDEYIANSEFEDIIHGSELRDGMIVLLAESFPRTYNQDATRRWCTVSKLCLRDQGFDVNPLVSFVGVYPDGALHLRQYGADHYWIVKKESQP